LATLAACGGLCLFLASLIAIRLTDQVNIALPPWVSLANRLLIVTYCIWLMAAARCGGRLLTATRGNGGEQEERRTLSFASVLIALSSRSLD
jgi:hypothetical protein